MSVELYFIIAAALYVALVLGAFFYAIVAADPADVERWGLFSAVADFYDDSDAWLIIILGGMLASVLWVPLIVFGILGGLIVLVGLALRRVKWNGG